MPARMQVAADRHPQRQRHVDRPAGRRDERLSVAADVLAQLPQPARPRRRAWPSASRAASSARRGGPRNIARGILTGGTLFEELGFYYVGPIDGHNLDHLLPVLRNVRDAEEAGPILLHVDHPEGQGLRARPRPSADKYHGVSQVQRRHRRAGQGAAGAAELHQGVRRRADRRGRGATTAIVAITAAMPSRHRARPLRQALPGPHLRRRHRRAARRDLRRRAWRPRA